MARLRKLGSEFTHPDQVKVNTLLQMPYLDDMKRYQSYLDGDMQPLYAYFTGEENSAINDVTGYKYYFKAGIRSLWQINFFRTISEIYRTTTFEEDPVPDGASKEEQDAWLIDGRRMIDEVKRGVDWLIAKGRFVAVVEKQITATSTLNNFRCVDPVSYFPIVHIRNRDLVLGHILVFWNYGLDERLETDIAYEVDVDIIIDEDGAALSDGYLEPMNVLRRYRWSTQPQGRGVTADLIFEGTSNIQKVWTFGNDDSTFGESESNVFNSILALTNSRTSMTNEIRALKQLPAAIDSSNRDKDGRIVLDLLDPIWQIDVDSGQSVGGIGYVEPPGPVMSAGFKELYGQGLDNLAYSAGVPRETLGQNYLSNEPAEALTKLQQIFITRVIDIRDNLSRGFTAALPFMGMDTKYDIKWRRAPYEKLQLTVEELFSAYDKGLAEAETVQDRIDLPVNPNIKPPMQMMANNMNQLPNNSQENNAQPEEQAEDA